MPGHKADQAADVSPQVEDMGLALKVVCTTATPDSGVLP